ncbi:isochorismate synthase [Croceitalea vernalis]|uniref:isochorismate synthase n=1 Tax=Croceitalea vernalis TaxID=3075599 RepID=A0ABU3BGM1_9FLAO|nr:isochorismate synthase [Croceitalea sp. P007]MDT0621321.1 isochorismate synthase [Croceitalea sp. P007]
MHSPRKIEFESLIKKVENHKNDKLPLVMYCLPGDTVIRALFQKDDVLHHIKDFKERGFVFAPFDNSLQTIVLKSNTSYISDFEVSNQIESGKKEVVTNDEAFHLELVKKGIQEIRSGKLKKVVLSRQVQVETEKNELSIFKSALHKYPTALRYLWYHPKVGTWIGASPEQLLKVEGNQIHTTSLAGTLPVIDNNNPEWSQKEFIEQQMVTDFLKVEIAEFVNDIKTTKVSSVKAGKLWHLKTNITADLKSFDQLKPLLKRIHPSPAVCGVPKDLAKKFILEYESYRRNYYTGFLGELNLTQEHSTSLYVNLRCMSLDANQATIFIGGGITEASNPEMEWQETNNKCQTMLSLL